jgi:Dolichyl-phosphate-mannose-protein mannosyltransferase
VEGHERAAAAANPAAASPRAVTEGRPTESSDPVRRWELVVLLAVVLLAGWLRLRHLDLVEFKFDESSAVDLARRLLDGTLPTVGLTSSVGALNPPLFIYLTAIPLAVRDDPLAATAFVGVLAVVAVGLTYVVLRARFGALAALTAAVLFATSPWAVLYGRKIWAQDLLPVFTVSLFWSLLVVLERPRTRVVLLVPVLLCVTFQLNFSALALGVPTAVLLLYRAREVNWPAFGLGIVTAAALLAPWLGHEATHGFEDVVKLVTENRGHGGSSVPLAGTGEAILQTVRLTGDWGWHYVVGTSQALFAADAGRARTLGEVASGLAAALLALGLVTCVVRVVHGTSRRRGWPFVELDEAAGRRALLVVWLAGVWLSHATSATNRVFPHYLIVTYPVSFAVQAVGLSDVLAATRGRHHRLGVTAAAAVVAIVVVGYVAFTLSFQRFVDREGGAAGDYGVVYRDKSALARFLRERNLRAPDEPVVDFLVTGRLYAPIETAPVVAVRDELADPTPLPCDGDLRTFGPLAACLPRDQG